MKVRIYKPSKNAMQSGRRKTEKWCLEYELTTPRRPEPLMGWTGAGDALNQVLLRFDTKESAIEFAERRGWTYALAHGHERRPVPRNYGDNFRYMPPSGEKK